MRIHAAAAVLVLGAGFAGGAGAQVNKCVNADGKTVYTQAPCPSNSKSKTLEKQPPAASAPAAGKDAKAGGKAAPSPEAAFQKREAAREETAKKDAEKAAELKTKQENCQRARQSMTQLEAGGRMTRFNDKGEREFLGDADVAQEKARTKALIDQWCSG